MLIDASHYGQRRGRGPSAAEPARRGAAAGAHRRTDAPGRAGGELLVPAPPGRLRVDRRAGPRRHGRRPRLRRGLRLGRARRARRRGGRGRRQPRGARARPAPLPATQPALRAHPGRALRRAPRRDRLPADDRARRRPRRPAGAVLRARAGRLRLDPEPAHARPRGGGEVRQPVAPARVHRRRVPRTGHTALRLGRALRPLSRRQAARPRAGAEGGLGSRPSGAAAHRSLLRLVRARDLRLGLRASTRGRAATSTGRSTSSPSAAHERTGRGGGPCARPPQPHALRRGLRHLSVRRGVAVRRGDPLLRAGLRAGRAADDDRHPGARRPARGRRGRRAPARVLPPLSDRVVRGRRRGRRLRARGRVRGRGRALPRGPGAPRSARRGPAAAVLGAGRRGPGRAARLRGHPRGPADARHPPGPRPADRRRPALAPAPLRRLLGPLAPRVRLRARARAAPGRARGELLLHRPERPRAADGGAGSGGDRSRAAGVHDRLGGGPMAVVARGLPRRPRLRRLPSQVAARRPAVGDRRRPLRPGRGRGACARARARVRGRGSPAAGGVRGRARSPGVARVRDRHGAARALVVGGARVARRGDRGGRGARDRAGDAGAGRRAPPRRRSGRCGARPGASART